MSEFASAFLKGFFKSLIVLFIICSVISVLMLFVDIPDSVIRYIGVIMLGFLCFLSAYFSTQIKRSKGLLQGLVSATVIYILLVALSLMFGRFTMSELVIIKLIVCVVCGIFGGIKGVNTKHTKVT